MRYRGVFEGHDDIMRRIIIRLQGLPPEIRELEDYERCYNCQMFDERAKGAVWDIEYDRAGNYIPQAQRRPNFQDPIGKEIIDSIAAFVFGSDRFPSIALKTTKDMYPSEDLVKLAIERGELKPEKTEGLDEAAKKRLKIKLCNEELQRLAGSILTQALLNPSCLEAGRLALIMGRSIVVMKVVEGIFYLEVINFKNVRNLKMSKKHPDRIESFSEMYLFEDKDPKDRTRTKVFWYRRDFTETEEIHYHPVAEDDVRNNLPEDMDWRKDPELTVKHDFGFCPAVLFNAPQGKSLFYGQLENIKAYVYMTNNIYTGLRTNMNPQWAVLFEPESMLNDQNFAPKKSRAIWAFTGAKDIKAIAPGTAGYETAREFRKELKDDILKACRVYDDIAPNNQQSGTALTIRMSPTLDAVGEYQICFGEKGLMVLCEMIIKTCILYNNRNKGILVRNDALIPEIDEGFIVSLGWGPKQPVTEDTIMAAVTNALTAYKGGLIDLHAAVSYIAPYFNIIDIEDMVKKIRERMEEMLGGEDAKQMYGRIMNKVNNDNKDLKNKGVDTGAGAPEPPDGMQVGA